MQNIRGSDPPGYKAQERYEKIRPMFANYFASIALAKIKRWILFYFIFLFPMAMLWHLGCTLFIPYHACKTPQSPSI
jgi:hypothetical protein